MKKAGIFERAARHVTELAGSTMALILSISIILSWILCGPIFDFSNTWQLAINSFTTIVTFLMVFLIQRSQNKDSKAIHLKLNELVASLKGPSNRLIDAEEMSEEELEILYRYYRNLSRMAKKEKDLSVSHSMEESEELHRKKLIN